jgi:small subunit ribosomal protein S8
MLDPIADMLTRIRNAQRARHSEVVLPSSNFKLSIAKVLERKGFIEKVEKIKKEGQFEELLITLKYINTDEQIATPAIKEIKRISKCGCRMYVSRNNIKPVRNGFGMAILSTSKGVFSDQEARKEGVGGELICEIW